MSPDPYISIHMYLKILCKIHVSDSCRAGETPILTSGAAFCVALRRKNSPTECFAQAKRKF